ncbi:MAG: bifunctional fucokinase/fucose-1-phosphate guanylyltransferase, partial [Candidatus Omnitrophica bacterium]|nr:bifunctional fucokinase/fucose-1-phosphate guanylyltransferase [Candidatus Omnitrophota bacterium]
MQGGSIQRLLSLPPRMAEEFEALEGCPRPGWTAVSDPPDSNLGSGGGTAHALVEAWRSSGADRSFSDWLDAGRKLIVLGGGQNRRLPAYAPVGKMLMPIPVFRWARGQRLTQTLLDLQLPEYRRVFDLAGSRVVAMVASGDVFLRLPSELPQLPAVDVLGLGMWVTPETAQHFGVFFSPRERPGELAFYLQKPSPSRIRQLSASHLYLVDSGIWLLSERAVGVILRHSGWDEVSQDFRGGSAGFYELYGQFGLALGQSPTERDAEVNALSSSVAPLPAAQFFHFGASRHMIESISALQNLELDETKLGLAGARRHPDQYLQNARFAFPLRLEENHTLWIENSTIPATWRLAFDHVLTGVPDNQWDLRLEPGVCLDFAPIGKNQYCVRSYGIDDPFAGGVGDSDTVWLGRSCIDWFQQRGIDLAAAGIDARTDIQEAPLFPVLTRSGCHPRFLEWLFAAKPDLTGDNFARRWLELPRLSASQIAERIDLSRLYCQRADNRLHCLAPMLDNHRWSVFFKLDLESTAKLYAEAGHRLPEPVDSSETGVSPMHLVRDQMFRAAVMRHRGQPDWALHEEQAFDHLRRMLERDAQLTPVCPQCRVIEDQIVWGRSPVRLDLAGGWTDTPPYCLENGGRVVNLAVDLNGQPPIQVFAKLSEGFELVMRSIDLGREQHVRTYAELEAFTHPGDEFALAKAAFALTGFLPRFHSRGGFASLEDQLRDFGGGIEVSLLSAVPKGSGLGTSSILSATLLATLGELCGLSWDREDLFARTLALEQMLTTGGGWQDQAGGLFRGIKLIETGPGLAQKPTLRWLPEYLFGNDFANQSILLYYTGLTRLAKNILREIVRGIFLNSPDHLETVAAIGANATMAFNAIQKADYAGLAAAVRTSWQLNQRLDSGTNPPAVQQILDRIGDYLEAAKLLGAGGGGYLLLLAKDDEAAGRLRQELENQPPNERARFVN